METQAPLQAEAGSENERNLLLVAYVLHGLALFNGITAIIGVVIDHIKVGESSSPFIISHHRWLIRTFWWGLLWFVVSSFLVWVLIGFVGYAVVGVWWIYRLVRGVINFSERKPMPV